MPDWIGALLIVGVLLLGACGVRLWLLTRRVRPGDDWFSGYWDEDR